MRKFLLMLLGAVLLFTACNKDDENNKFDANHRLYITGVNKANKAVRYENLSVEEIVRIDSVWLYSSDLHSGISELFEFALGNIDTINNRFAMQAGYINNGTYDNIFFAYRNYYLMRFVYGENNEYLGTDTLAYVPNKQITDAKAKIDSLFPLEKWSEIYEIFNNAFTFIPCTGAELRELEKSGNW